MLTQLPQPASGPRAVKGIRKRPDLQKQMRNAAGRIAIRLSTLDERVRVTSAEVLAFPDTFWVLVQRDQRLRAVPDAETRNMVVAMLREWEEQSHAAV